MVFFRRLMTKLGLADSWINIVMSCVTSVHYSFIINGDVFSDVSPSRRIMQVILSPHICLSLFHMLFHPFS